MSNFISSMPGGCLSEMPPLSKVTPLPTSTTGASPFAPPLWRSTISLAGSSVPAVTDRNDPIFRRFNSGSSSTSARTVLYCFASSRACFAR